MLLTEGYGEQQGKSKIPPKFLPQQCEGLTDVILDRVDRNLHFRCDLMVGHPVETAPGEHAAGLLRKSLQHTGELLLQLLFQQYAEWVFLVERRM